MKSLIALILVVASAAMIFTGFKSVGDVQTISGTVTDNVRPCGKLSGDDGNEYTIHLGPIWYWEDNKYELKLGTVQIKGEVTGNDIYPYEIIQDGKTMVFTDDKGVPKWYIDGKGKGYGKGNGKGYGRGNCPRNK